MKKKSLQRAALFGLTACVLGLTACAGNENGASEGGTEAVSSQESDGKTAVVEGKEASGKGDVITVGIWSDDEKKRLEAAFDGIESELGLKVEFMNYPSDSDFWDNIPAQIAAGTAPDIISCTNEHYLQYIEQGLFESLNPYIDSGAISTEGIDKTALSSWDIDGQMYGIPYALNPGVFIVNDTMWKKFGLGDAYPTTWDQVLQICEKVKKEQNMPALCLNVQEYHLTNYAISFGGGWNYGKTINSPENAEALQFLIDAYKKGYVITPTELGLSWDGAVMIQQSALFSTGGAWYQSSFADEAPDIELKYLAVPKGGNGNGGGTLHTAALVALKNSKHPDEVAKAIQYAFQNERLYRATIDVTQVIPAKSEYFNLYKEELPELSQLVDFLQTSKPFAYPSQSKMFADQLISLMQEALMDGNSTLTGEEIVTRLNQQFGSK